MKKIILTILIAFMAFAIQAQYIRIATMASGGGSSRVSNGYISQVVGQSSLVSGTARNQGVTLPQGFKQPAFSKKSQNASANQKQEKEPLLSFKAYPNPFTQSITVQLSSKTQYPVGLRCYDILGKLIWEASFPQGASEMVLDKFQNIQAGKYILQMLHQGKIQQLALIKQPE